MSIRTVGELREALADEPDYRPLALEQYVGGDLVTDDTALECVANRTDAGGPYVLLKPGPDHYDVCALVDEALAHRDAVIIQGRNLARALAGVRPWEPDPRRP